MGNGQGSMILIKRLSKVIQGGALLCADSNFIQRFVLMRD